MRCFVWISAAVLLIGTMGGCGNSQQKTEPTALKTSETSATTSSSAAKSTVEYQDPQKAVTSFLEALRGGNEQVAEALLTTKAREETARHNMVVQPPGTPNATYEVGRVEYPKDRENTAYVACTWSEAFDDGTKDAYEVVWVLHQEASGWHVAGMATELSESGPLVFLNFENPSEMMEKVRQAEQVANRPAPPQAAPPKSEKSAIR